MLGCREVGTMWQGQEDVWQEQGEEGRGVARDRGGIMWGVEAWQTPGGVLKDKGRRAAAGTLVAVSCD